MMRHSLTVVLCAGLLRAISVDAKTDPSIDSRVLEARWQTYAKSAQQTQPALEFPYAQCFSRAAIAHDLPETLLLAVARGESDFKPMARSKANAYGLMQILWPGTAKHLGLERLSEVLDPCTNVDAGARYLKELQQRYHGDLNRTLAAYNYGPERIPVSGGRLPEGAVWYSAYIMRHLDYVLNGRSEAGRAAPGQRYSGQGRLFIIHFSRPYRAAAFVDRLQPGFGELRLDWFRRAAGGFDVVMLYANEAERSRGQQLLGKMGFG
ncbi:MAG: lytic transglycosylase domain-containing protein [Pseudomonadota bacterium]